jgi:signal transduction histidine kinase
MRSFPGSRVRTHRLAALLLGGVLLALLHPIVVAQTPQKSVLVLINTRRDAPVSAVLDRTIRTALNDGLAGGLDYYTEYLDVARFPGPEYHLALRDFIRRKYAGQTFDVVVATSDPMVGFARDYRDEFWPAAAVVFIASSAPSAPSSAGVVSRFDLKATIDLALQLHPDLQHVFVMTGVSDEDRSYAELAREQFRAFDGRLDISYSTGLAMPELLRRVAELPPRSIVYFLTFFEDAEGSRFVAFEAFNLVAAAANAPLYHWTDIGMGHGMVGGSVVSMEIRARAAATVALRVLRGEPPDRIPVQEIDAHLAQFDWRQLQRWGISETRLPAGSLVLFPEPTLWERYRVYIVGVTSVVLLQTALIGGLLVQRVRRRRTERALRESEAALRSSNDQNQDLAGRLITAQEDERRHIARELHDDFNQRLALLSVEMELLGHGESDVDVGARSGRLAAQLRGLSSDVHKLSHRLHPAKVEQLGLVTAARSWCGDLAKQTGLRIDFSARNVPADLPSAISLNLYRIVQESLHNVVRHSEASGARVELVGEAESLRLTVSDQGQGFAINDAKRTGLGLVGMQERMRLVRGTIAVTSSPGQGTRVEATVPLSPASVPAERLA